MSTYPEPLDLSKLRVLPLAERRSKSKLEEVLQEPTDAPPPCDAAIARLIRECAQKIRAARERNASVMLIYGAHLIKNGAQLIINQMLDRGLITHLATNGAGSIHDWEFSWLGRSEEDVRENVATGTFGTWNETGRNIHLALLAGGLLGNGYGRSVGRIIQEDGIEIPKAEALEAALRAEPAHPLSPARADFLQAIRAHNLPSGRQIILHPRRNASVQGHAFRLQVPLTVHPGIGYDIIANHPMFNGAVIGRAAAVDFRLFCRAVEGLDGGVVLSVGSAIMSPQVFEKSISCVNNLRLQEGRGIVRDHSIYVVDLQESGHWDWSQGEPPKDNPAYYLRFCKSFVRMGGTMQYVPSDNVAFLHNLLQQLAMG